MPLTLTGLRRHVVRRALFEPGTVTAAVERIGFVQSDPIRAPARAQDLILRHRVTEYRAGDLERVYPTLALEEDVVYAYGFLPAAARTLLHPRGDHEPAGLARDVLAFVRERGATHPRTLLEAFGDGRESNAWGGESRAATRALESLHYWGLLRVARRERGVRVYEPARPAEPVAPAERARRLVLLVVRVLAPVPEPSWRQLLSRVRASVPALPELGDAADAMLRAGELERHRVAGTWYIWPAADDGRLVAEPSHDVRLLAPFDPLVWDRRRFELFWGWPYRFEAYTPAPRRRLGYYALPMLWRDRVIGWANLAVRGGELHAAFGFAERKPRNRAFARALDAEIERVRDFLGLARR